MITHETSDLCLAVFLSLNHELKEINKDDSRRCQFVFEDNPRLQADIHDFWKGDALVAPKDFFNNMRDLKARIYDR